MLTPGTRFGPYEITNMLGAGGMGEVYRAKDLRLKRDVALKVLPPALASDPGRLARFQREAEVLASLDHPHIAGIYGSEVSNNLTALILQLVDGETLADRIARGPLPVDEALHVARQMADALAAAHRHGIIHRDLKPSNISITADNTIKVLDFGLAKLIDSPATAVASSASLSPTMTSPALVTGAEVLLGTAAYMSPEQAKGKAVDKRADVWAFGCVLYEMLTGERLHQGETVSETVAAVLKESPDLMRVPVRLRRLLRSCLQKDPERRLHDIADWHLLVDDEDLVVRDRPAPTLRWVWPAVAALVVVAAAALAYALLRQPAAVVEELRSQIPAPEGLTFNPGTQAAISPDGRWLAFAALGPDNVSRMYIRSLSSLEVRPLPGSEGILALSPPPFWSYDSRYVVYGALGKLRKSEITGTPAQTIAETGAPFVQGGTWNQSGVILYARNSGRLEQVSEAGGTPVPVTELAPGEIAHRWPQFLPDGRHFIYLKINNSPDQNGLYLGSLDAKPGDQSKKMLLPTNRQAWWVSSEQTGSAFLILQREETLLAQPFDFETATLSGTPVLVASGVGSFAGATAGLWSVARNGALTYRAGGAGLPQLTWRDLNGKVLGTVGEGGLFGVPAVSPDGTRVAYRLVDAQGNPDIYVRDLSRGTPIKLTFSPGIDDAPVWSPDSKTIYFAGVRDGRRDLYEKNADGSGEERLLFKSEQEKTPFSVSRDGQFLLFGSIDPKTQMDLWLLPLQGERKPFLFVNSPGTDGLGQISNDRKWIVYAANATGQPELTVRPFPTSPGGPAEGSKWIIATNAAFARWSPNGKQLYYLTITGDLIAVDVDPGNVWKPADPKRLFGGLPPAAWSWHPDGQRLRLVQTRADSAPPPPFTLVLNWLSRLERE
jgi:Tol biopolymer transport system component